MRSSRAARPVFIQRRRSIATRALAFGVWADYSEHNVTTDARGRILAPGGGDLAGQPAVEESQTSEAAYMFTKLRTLLGGVPKLSRKETLELLNASVREWNAFREKYPHWVPNLIEVKLNGKDLSNVDFHGAKLYRAKLARVDFNRANLAGARLNGASLKQADLRDANLAGAQLCDANLAGANLDRADLSDADMRDVIW